MKKLLLLSLICILISYGMTGCSGAGGSSPGEPQPGGEEVRTPVSFDQLPASSRELSVPGPQFYVNVMGKQRSALPAFKNLPVRPDWLRGYVKDVYGRPLKGTRIGVRSSLIGGAYSSASADTDEQGYYEILLPAGTVEIWGARYFQEYESGRVPVSLFPADSSLSSFTSTRGAVKNFVLVPYGLTAPEAVAKGPYWPSSYMGGRCSPFLYPAHIVIAFARQLSGRRGDSGQTDPASPGRCR